MKTQRELNQKVINTLKEFIRVIEMVDEYNEKNGACVNPSFCIKDQNSALFNFFVKTSQDDFLITPAVAILYDERDSVHKPVFPGDPIWIKDNPHPVNWDLFGYWKEQIEILSKDWTWVKPQPKRTFEINGVELPCPLKRSYDADYVLNIHFEGFYFKNISDGVLVRDAIVKLLEEARDK